MPPSDRRVLISLLVAFAVVVPGLLRPSAATRRVEGSAEAAAPSSPDDREVLRPAGLSVPDLPLPQILPCPPLFPKIPLIPCYNVTPPPPATTDPRECLSSLRSLTPCAGFLTINASVPAPPTTCCDGFDRFVANRSSAPLLCLRHIATGDIARLLPAPMNHTRAASVMEECSLGLPIDALSRFCKNNRDEVPPIDPPNPPSAAAETKHCLC
ncbi:hypothetical protein GQ55_2G118300 [Panicum hallii var. hallii]|uniref:Bifunctional inhibitor/plant lipid transfer protein/seed storage helical domain-containing protein n=1 Tax=Panicum hallii var. hallii TaxID=1504633 RepID=A0A2T7ENZ2_9POAL|nr:hypothetical protein GQ55_2G118300 [Panicum hallii var. hallii]